MGFRAASRDTVVSVINFVKRSYLAYLSKPAGRRPLYRIVGRQPVRTIVQIGLHDLGLIENLLWSAAQTPCEGTLRFIGVDLFEMRGDDESPLGLKEAHQRLQNTRARVKLVPGDPHSALSRNANSLCNTDMILVSSHVDRESMGRAWFFVPRMLHEQSVVLRQIDQGPKEAYEQVSRSEIDRLSVGGYDARRRAA